MKINGSVIINKQYLIKINRKGKNCILKVNEQDNEFCMPLSILAYIVTLIRWNLPKLINCAFTLSTPNNSPEQLP